MIASAAPKVPLTSFVGDFFGLIGSAIALLSGDKEYFLLAIVVAFFLAGLCWWGASRYSHLWNRRFRVTAAHHLLCLLAALLTLVYVVLFASIKYTQVAAEASIDRWRIKLLEDKEWWQRVFKETYVAVKNLGVEDFSNYPPPESGGNRIPLNQQLTRQRVAQIYVNEAISNFRTEHPFLSSIFWIRSDVPAEDIQNDVNEFFRKGGQTYAFETAIEIAAREIKSDLQRQTNRVVPMAWGILIALFALVRLIPFGWIGYAAYRDLKVTT
jgi:hypothetical protein